MYGWRGRAYAAASFILPIKTAFSIRYYHWNHRWPNLDMPKRFTEKMMWLTRFNELYNDELIKKTYDKFTVREYVKEKGLERILVEQYGHYYNAQSIDFNSFPNEYILKATQSSGQNIIVTNNSSADRKAISTQFDEWLTQHKKRDRFQGYYFTDQECVICEKLLRDENGKIPTDIWLCCCNGEVKWIYCDLDTTDENMKHRPVYFREYFDRDWNYLPVDNVGRIRKNKDVPTFRQPENLKELILNYSPFPVRCTEKPCSY